MHASLIIIALLAAAASSAHAQAYLQPIAYLHDPSKFNTNYKPQKTLTGILSVAELNHNSTSQEMELNWELDFETSATGKPFPTKLKLVAYRASLEPSNRKTLMTLASRPRGLRLGETEVQGVFTLSDMKKAFRAKGKVLLPTFPKFCDIKNDTCQPGPGTLLNVADNLLAILEFSDRTVAAGFFQLDPKIPLPEPTDDEFYVGTFTGSFGANSVPFLGAPDDVTIAIGNTFDKAGNWALNVLTSYNTSGAAAIGFKLVTKAGTKITPVLDLTSKIDWKNTTELNEVGLENVEAFTIPGLKSAMKAAGITVSSEIFGAVTTVVSGTTYVNYMPFDPVWVVDPSK